MDKLGDGILLRKPSLDEQDKTMSTNETKFQRLTVEEIDYIANACKRLPEEQKDQALIDSLSKKLTRMRRLAVFKHHFPELQ
jgi:hypothetical protein